MNNTHNEEKDNSSVFMPLNISYPIKKSSERKLLYFIISTAVFVILLIVIMKIRSDFFFSTFVTSPVFLVLTTFVSICIYVFMIRKLVLRENQQMKLYRELLAHEEGTISDLWEIHSITSDICSFFNNNSKIFVKLEKGFTISRVSEHEKNHREAFKLFLRDISSRGYDIEYFNYHLSDSNTAPLESNFQVYVNKNKNEKLRKFGAELLREYRNLDDIGDSTIEYIAVTSKTPEDTAYLRSTVENACSYLEDSLYVDVKICDNYDLVEMLQTIYKVSGINIQDLMDVNVSDISQQFVKIVRVIGNYDEYLERNNEDESYDEAEEMRKYIEELENEVQIKNESEPHENPNLMHKGVSNRPILTDINEQEIEDQLNFDRHAQIDNNAYVVPVFEDEDEDDEEEVQIDYDDSDFDEDESHLSADNESSNDTDDDDDDLFDDLFNDIKPTDTTKNINLKKSESDDTDFFDDLFKEVNSDVAHKSSNSDVKANSENDEDDFFDDLFKEM